MSSKRETLAVILAAGKGTRMKSNLPKVLHTLLGKPLVSFVIDACKKAGVDRSLLVIGHKADLVKRTIGPGVEYVLQTEQLGTGHALMMAADQLGDDYIGDVLVLVGDAPFLTGDILAELVSRHQQTGAAATMMTAIMDPPPAYGRIVRDASGRVQRIVEERDATAEEKKITEVNTSHYCFNAEKVFPLLKKLSTDNDQGEYYLTDIVEMLSKQGDVIETLTAEDADVLKGINDKAQLVAFEKELKDKLVARLVSNDVIIPAPELVYIEPQVEVGAGTRLMPFTTLEGETRIGENCIIGPQTTLSSASIGDDCEITHSVVKHRDVTAGNVIGPFASLSKEQN